MRSEETAWREHLAPLGIPTRVIADTPELLATAVGAYAEWKEEAGAGEPAIILRLGSGTASSSNVCCEISVEGSRLTLEGGGISGHADAATKRAECALPPRLIGDPAALAAQAIDTLLLFLLARSGRTPVHAAGIVTGDTALLLAGPSGSGKSTLALAAAARGLRVLSDDTVYVQTEPTLRIWGWPGPIHLFPQDAPAGRHEVRIRGGKRKLAVPLDRSSEPPSADEARLILLERGDKLSLTPVAPEAAMAALARLEPGFDLLPAESARAARSLTEGGAWRLSSGTDPRAAIDLLCDRLGTDTARR